MSFTETFLAVSTTLAIAWAFKKYIEPILDKTHETVQNIRRNNNKMGKLMIDIEVASNGSYIVTWYKNVPNAIQKLGGSKTEKEQLAFTNAETLVKWITEQGRR